MFPLLPNEFSAPSPGQKRPGLMSPEFSPQERRLLLQVAHEAIRAALEGKKSECEIPPRLAEVHGVFTTLYLHGQLRGCVGYVFPVMPLHHAVAETACAAAFNDPRFPPLKEEEVSGLSISLSILSPLMPVSPEQIEIGQHGLLVSLGGSRGLLLPQVAVEHGWDRNTFLEQTCHKAGLPADAWKHGAQIEVFTAEVFGDENFARE